MEAEIPGHEPANAALAQLNESLEQDNSDLTTDYLVGDFLAQRHPAVQWLQACVNKTVFDYFDHLDMGYPINWSLQGWPNVNRTRDYHDPHNNPHAYLRGTYYVSVPDGSPAIGSRKDVRSGCIGFYDPRVTANMTAIRRDPNIEAEFTVRPRAGLILLWPAFLQHCVHRNLCEEPRISVSFNVMLKWSDEYLPDQG